MPEEYVKSLADLLDRQYQARTSSRINPVADEVDVAITQVLAANPRRVGFLIINLSLNTIFIAPDMQVAATRGIYLSPSGGSFSALWSEDFELVSLPWYGTATANDSAIIAIELQIE